MTGKIRELKSTWNHSMQPLFIPATLTGWLSFPQWGAHSFEPLAASRFPPTPCFFLAAADSRLSKGLCPRGSIPPASPGPIPSLGHRSMEIKVIPHGCGGDG